MADQGCTLCDRTDEHIHRGDGWEVRYVELDNRPALVLDEVLADGATVHLEGMSESDWSLILDMPDGTQIRIGIGARHGRAHVDALIVEVDGPRPEDTHG